MADTRIVPVILCGGAGARLWPLTAAGPKPLLPLTAEGAPLERLLATLASLPVFAPAMIVTAARHAERVRALLASSGLGGRLLLEPEARDTAAAFAAAAAVLAAEQPQSLLMAFAADQVIGRAGLAEACDTARKLAERGLIAVFAVRPLQPSEAYGYVLGAGPVAAVPQARHLQRFVEKPVRAEAVRLIEAGAGWNSGNFLGTAATVLEEIDRWSPSTLRAVRAALPSSLVPSPQSPPPSPLPSLGPSGDIRLGEDFRAAPAISFDRAVMEKTARAALVAADFEWLDLGAWPQLWAAADKDGADNAVTNGGTGKAPHVVGAHGCYLHSDGSLPLVVAGARDLIVVATDEGVLIADRNRPELLAEALRGRHHGEPDPE